MQLHLPKIELQWLPLCRRISIVHHLDQFMSLAIVSALFRSRGHLPFLNSVLHSFALGPFPNLAISFYDSIRIHGVVPDNYTFTSTLKAAARLFIPQRGREIHSLSFKLGLESDTFVLNSLIHMYSVCGLLGHARKAFDLAPDFARDLVSWNSMISGYSQSNHCDEALQVFCEMVRRSIRFDAMTPVGALSACGRRVDLDTGQKIHALVVVNGFHLDFYLGSSLVSMYARCGAVDLARQLFDGMPQRNVVCWTSMISGYAHSGLFVESIELFRQMQMEGVKADSATIASVVSSCAQTGALDQGRYLHAYCDTNGLGMILNVKNALIDMYSKCGDINRALQIFKGLVQKDVFSWTVMISGLAMNGYSEEALDLFSQMEAQAEVKANEVTFLGVLSACSHGGMVEKGYYYFNCMTKVYGLIPKIEHYGCMVDLLGRAKLVVQAEHLIRDMPIEPDAVIWRSLLFACRSNGNVKLAEFATGRIMKLEPRRCGSHVLLSNVYASTSRWTDVNRVRKVMHDNSIRKQPGCSFIEVNGVVHEFLVSDSSHPQIGVVHWILSGLNRLLLSETCLAEELKLFAVI
ncbi:pentatricopeptide repeat-containing protein At1g08070, chloroplastic-like [Dioscorea cayenensis subsp. rotundata]|uniref:Pentatricopeptide repeat-containing protein At1g08070, chloroplastic-like n=1 Tax=Dioscorea cayennensis subsp. rotundata TaxID=55577 RepID=A0AB40AJS9_DIOCR|nr:pentatricopeptide repeat-containing protein At1g08070, chloroplastic-like [Dioscorea cayenensis subsp. rotundata]